MSAPLGQLIAAVSVPITVATGGGVLATRRPPAPKVRSAVQHFAAGLVFAVAATELIPDLSHDGDPGAVAAGFLIGLALLLTISFVPQRLAARRGAVGESPVAALAAIGVDVLIDGLLMGIAFGQGGHAGLLLTAALTVELAFLGLSIVDAMTEGGHSNREAIVATGLISLLLLVGGVAGVTVLGDLHGNLLAAVLAFATVALLYLVTEELLTEAHEQPDTPLLTSLFFIGFLILLLLSMVGE